MTKSKTKIEKQLKRKTNPEIVETIIKAKKNDAWKKVAGILSSSKRNWISKNIFQISNEAESSKKIVVPGKVLSQGEIDKKIKIIAVSFSEKAKEKLLNKGCEVNTILEEIKSNPSGKDIKILK